MNNEITNNEQVQDGITLKELWNIVKRNIVLIIAIVLLFTAGGVVYSYMQKPSYTASEKVIFTCQNHNQAGQGTTSNYSTMMQYVDTIIQFSGEGVVLDRANWYYMQYKNSDYNQVDKYIDEVINVTQDNYDSDYMNDQENAKKYHFDAGSMGINSIINEEDNLTQVAFTINYTDQNRTDAYDKIKLIVSAFAKEVLVMDGSEFKYFGNFSVIISDQGNLGVVANSSKLKSIVLFVAIGVVAAGLVVCVKTLMDNTVKTREDLERITGVPVLASIDNKE